MVEDLPRELRDVVAIVYDFNTGEELASGHANIDFVEHTDRLRVRRELFRGVFVPETEEGAETLKRRLISGLSTGAPAMSMQVDYGRDTWVFTVKFELGEMQFDFSGRAEPKRI